MATNAGQALHVAQRYRLERELGWGSFGEVYLVFDEREQRHVALKIAGRKLNPQLRAAFRREYALLTQLAHPDVVRVFDYGEHEGAPYYTLEWLEGEAPGARGPMPVREVCRMLVALCGPLALMHTRRWVHRDLSPHNVMLLRDGRVKLLDFGATATMEPQQSVLGTPPCVAPETLNRLRLDARTDLFGLGALGYYALTGRHAYPARALTQLPLLWQTPPIKPSQLVERVPPALDELLLSLLSADITQRPRQLGEVLRRLFPLAELEPDRQLEVAASSLPTPGLVGRERELATLRRLLESSAGGHGTTCIVRGARGSGCTRTLDAMALEAKLLGRTVVRARAGLCPPGPYGLIFELCHGLGGANPAVATVRALLEHAALDEQRGVQAQRAFIQLCEELCHVQPLLFIVDECEACDLDSARMLVQLARRTTELPLVLALSLRGERSHQTGPLSALGRDAWWIELEPLAFEASERLLTSLFGDVQGLTHAARWAHAVGGGQPSGILAAARALVVAGVATFVAGSWRLRDDVPLPALVEGEAALARTLNALSSRARDMLAFLSLVTQPAPLDHTRYPRALSPDEHERALIEGELFAAQLLVWTDSGYTLRDPSILPYVRAQLTAAEATRWQRRLAEHYTHEGQPLLAAFHLWQAGELEAADAAVEQAISRPPRLDGRVAFRFALSNDAANLYEAVLLHRMARGAPPSALHRLRMTLLITASTSRTDLVKFAPATIAQLRFDAGLDLWDAERRQIRACMALAQERFDATPEAARGLPPAAAVQAIAFSVVMLTSLYALQCDARGVLELPGLIEPLRGLGPSYELIALITEQSLRSLVYGEDVRGLRSRVLAQTREPVPGLDESSRHVIHHINLFYFGLEYAIDGADRALEIADQLCALPAFEALGVQVRRVHALAHGRFEEAQAFRRARELLTYQSASTDNHLRRTDLVELQMLAYCRDPLELSRLAAQIEQRAQRAPGIRPYAALARCWVEMLADEPANALEIAAEALQEMAPFTHAAYPFLIAAEGEALIELHRYEHAEAALEQLFRDAAAHSVVLREVHPSHMALAVAQVGNGKRQQGMAALDRLLRLHAEEHGASTVRYGRLCEARCQASCFVNDYSGFGKHLERLAPIYARHPSLRARHARWVRIGRERFHKLIEVLAQANQAAAWSTRIQAESRAGTRAHHAEHLLSMLLEELEVDLGQLFLIDAQGELVLLAAKPSPADEQLLLAAERCLASWSESDEMQTADGDVALEARDTRDRTFIPLWLTRPEQPDVLCGLVLVACTTQRLGKLSPVLVRAISQQLDSLLVPPYTT